MIKSLLSGKQVLIASLVFILLVNTTNLSFPNAIADEKEDIAEAIRGMEFVNDDEDDTGLKPFAIEQACKDNGGQWKDSAWCKFDKDKTGDEVEFEHQLEDRGLSYYYADNEYLGEEWDKYQQEKYEKENKVNDDNDFTWFDYDNDGALTEYDVDMMCDDTNAYEEDCKKAYNWIERSYGYETEEDDYDK